MDPALTPRLPVLQEPPRRQAWLALLLLGGTLLGATVQPVLAQRWRGGVGGPASGAGVRPGAGWGAPGAGLTRPGVNPGGLGGPASGAGLLPGAGWGAPGAGLGRGPGVGTWNPAWARTGYWGARTWSYGWYRVNPGVWPWWSTSAAAWGLTGLATAATVTSLVNASVAQQSTVIVVPQTSLRLDYASVQAVRPSSATFAYTSDGITVVNGLADCQAGLLGGQPPTSAAQAQLLNAVCHIAYGTP